MYREWKSQYFLILLGRKNPFVLYGHVQNRPYSRLKKNFNDFENKKSLLEVFIRPRDILIWQGMKALGIVRKNL